MHLRKKKDPLGEVMSKVARGYYLSPHEREILSAGIDGAKKAKTERR